MIRTHLKTCFDGESTGFFRSGEERPCWSSCASASPDGPRAGARADRCRKVIFLCPVGQVGGAEISMLDLMSRMSEDGFEVAAILLNTGPLEQRLKDRNIRHRVYRLVRPLRTLSRSCRPSLVQLVLLPFLLAWSVIRLRRIVLSGSPDVVVSNGIKCHVLSALALVRTKTKRVWHVRDILAGGLVGRTLRLLARLSSSLVVTNSHAVAETIPTNRTIAIHNGIDLEAFHPAVRPLDETADLHLPAEAIVLGAVGHFAPIKGFDTLIASLSLILERVPGAHLVIAGDAVYETHKQYKQHLTDEINTRALGDRVHFLGFVEDVPRLLASLDLFVSASNSEGFGRAVAEAMAVGCPVVATEVGGVGELVRDRVHGLLVPPGQPQALAAAVVEMVTNRGLKDRLAAQGARRIQAEFGAQRHAQRFVSVLRSVLSGPAVPIGARITRRADRVSRDCA